MGKSNYKQNNTKEMCGIAGILGGGDRETIQKMIDSMAHRGPDGEGVYIDSEYGIALGHRRLSIIDLTDAGKQPMQDESGRFWIVFNGEIYNYKELREQLQTKGYAFHSHTDTEVVINGYREWGEQVVSKLRGMFAFAIYDRGSNFEPKQGEVQKRNDSPILFLARDRFGIKPLYWYQKGSTFIFASSLTSILKSGYVERRLNPQSLWDYLTLGSVPPPLTMIEGIHSLEPAHTISFSGKTVNISRYWDIKDAHELPKDITYDEAKEQFMSLMEESTRLHTIADVPVGAFLSGGLDSTIQVALMSQQSTYPLKTFSVGFESTGNFKNELSYARIAAKAFGTDHTEVILSRKSYLDEFDRFIEMIDQPSTDGLNTYFVSKAASKDVKVALSGLGADELFAGYGHFFRFGALPEWTQNGISNNLADIIFGLNWLPGRLRLWSRWWLQSDAARHSSIRVVFSESEKKLLFSRLFNEFHPLPTWRHFVPWLKNIEDPIKRVTYCEVRGYLTHTLLRDADAMSMAHSLEVRVPFLDHRLAEFAYEIPSIFKIENKIKKKIVRDATQQLIPEEILNRVKQGFNLPVEEWLPKLNNQNFEKNTTLESEVLTRSEKMPNFNFHPQINSAQKSALIILNRWIHYTKADL